MGRNINDFEWSGTDDTSSFKEVVIKAISRSNPEVQDEFQDPWHENETRMSRQVLSTMCATEYKTMTVPEPM